MGSPVAWASCLGAEGPKDTRRLVQVALVPGIESGILTGTKNRPGAEMAMVVLSWVKSNEDSILEALKLASFPRPLGALLPQGQGLHVHIAPGRYKARDEFMAVTMALALLSLASGRRCDDSIAVMGSLRLDGARVGRIPALNQRALGRCLAQGISHLVVGVEQVSG